MPPRDLIGKLIQNLPNLQLLRDGPNPLLDGVGIGMVRAEGQADVLLQGQGVQKVAILKDKPQPFPAKLGQLTGGELGNALSIQQDVPGADGVNGGDAVEQRGLSAARGPHNGDERPILHGKAHPVQGLCHLVLAAIVFLNVLYLQHDTRLLC